jgi:conjugative relaxase-like TrwC/TraI family protein
MSATTHSMKQKEDYIDLEYFQQATEFGIEPKYHGFWKEIPFPKGLDEAGRLHWLMTEGLLERKQANFTPGWMVTFSAPKDWALAVNARFGHSEAANMAKLVQQSAEAALAPTLARAESRLGAGGKTRVHGEAAWATFPEIVSRAGDLQPHVHVVVPNAVRCPDGKIRANASARGLFVDQKVLDSRFLKELADRVQKEYGLKLVVTEKGFAVQGFPAERVRSASNRTQAIDKLCKERGWTTPQQRQIAAYLTRPEKADYKLAERWATWKAETRQVVPDVAVLFDLKKTPVLTPDQVTARAVGIVLKAADKLTTERATFTAKQLQTEVMTLARVDATVPTKALDAGLKRVLDKPQMVSWEVIERKNAAPLYTSRVARMTRDEPPKATVRTTAQGVVKTLQSGAAAFTAVTAQAAAVVVHTLKKAFTKPEEVVFLRGDLPPRCPASVDGFVKRLNKMPYLAAHKDALTRGLREGRGNLVERLEYAEALYRQNRKPREKLHKNQVIVVADPQSASVKALQKLEKKAKRAGATVVYADSPHQGRRLAQARREAQAQNQRKSTKSSEHERERS